MLNNRTGIPGVMLLKIKKENKHIEDKNFPVTHVLATVVDIVI
jgi:hypothetical protein